MTTDPFLAPDPPTGPEASWSRPSFADRTFRTVMRGWDPKEVRAYLEELDRLRDLGYPEDAQEELAAAYDVYEARFTEWRDDPSLVAEGAADPEVVAAGETLADYGLPACGADL